jgi:hypothetical protein
LKELGYLLISAISHIKALNHRFFNNAHFNLNPGYMSVAILKMVTGSVIRIYKKVD